MSIVVYVCKSADGTISEVSTLAEARAFKEKNGGSYSVKYVPYPPKDQ